MSLKQRALHATFWTGMQQLITQIIGFVLSMVLARLLMPKDFGLIAMISVFMGISSILIYSGLGSSLIKEKKVTDVDLSTVFFFNFFSSIFFYFLLFFTSPFISNYFNEPILTKIIRIYSITFIINAVTTIQIIRLQKELNFKIETYATIISAFISSIVGVLLAFKGFGVMSLVYMPVIAAALKTIYVWIFSGWKPKLIFNNKILKKHLKFGINLTFVGILDVVFNNIYNIFIGKQYNASALGFYNRADSLKQIPVIFVVEIIRKISYPLLSEASDNDVFLKETYKKIIKLVNFIITPIMMFSIVLAEPLIIILFGEEWRQSIHYFQILCFAGIIFPLRVFNTNILLVKGRSDLFFKLEIIKKTIFILIFLVVYKFDIIYLLWSFVVFNIICYIIDAKVSGDFINYSLFTQIKDIFPDMIISSIIATIVMILNSLINNQFLSIILSGFVGFCLYILIQFKIKNKSLNIILDFIKIKSK